MKLLLLIKLILFGLVVQGQFNNSVTHHIQYGSTGIINKTNDGSSYVLTNVFRFNINKKSIRLNSTNSWIYGEQQKRLTNNDYTSTLDFNLFKTFPHFYYWGLANYEKSHSLKVNNRFQTGLGIAYNLIDKPNTFLNFSDGIIYESSNLKVNDSTNNTYQTFRNSLRFRYRFVLKEIIVFDGVHFLQNSLSNNQDYIIKSVSSLTFKVKKWLGFTTAATYNRNERTRRENLLITFGLTAEKYF